MSGGSHDYLCYVDTENLFNRRHQLKTMRDSLTDVGAFDAANETDRLYSYVIYLQTNLEMKLEKLAPVWKALEWWQSGDTSEESFRKALEKYKGN